MPTFYASSLLRCACFCCCFGCFFIKRIMHLLFFLFISIRSAHKSANKKDGFVCSFIGVDDPCDRWIATNGGCRRTNNFICIKYSGWQSIDGKSFYRQQWAMESTRFWPIRIGKNRTKSCDIGEKGKKKLNEVCKCSAVFDDSNSKTNFLSFSLAAKVPVPIPVTKHGNNECPTNGVFTLFNCLSFSFLRAFNPNVVFFSFKMSLLCSSVPHRKNRSDSRYFFLNNFSITKTLCGCARAVGICFWNFLLSEIFEKLWYLSCIKLIF